MKVFHTGQVEIPVPDIHYGRRNADFGQGFYLTPKEACQALFAETLAAMSET